MEFANKIFNRKQISLVMKLREDLVEIDTELQPLVLAGEIIKFPAQIHLKD